MKQMVQMRLWLTTLSIMELVKNKRNNPNQIPYSVPWARSVAGTSSCVCSYSCWNFPWPGIKWASFLWRRISITHAQIQISPTNAQPTVHRISSIAVHSRKPFKWHGIWCARENNWPMHRKWFSCLAFWWGIWFSANWLTSKCKLQINKQRRWPFSNHIEFFLFFHRYGRRGPLVFAVMAQLLCGIATAFVPYFWLFCTLRFLSAVATGGTMVTSFVLVMELVGTKWRDVMSVLYQIPFNLGHLTLPLFAYFFRDWHHLQLALSIPSLLLISYYWIVPVSIWHFLILKVFVFSFNLI